MDRSRWRKQIGMIDGHDECEWVNVIPDKIHRAVKQLCVCVCFLSSCQEIIAVKSISKVTCLVS